MSLSVLSCYSICASYLTSIYPRLVHTPPLLPCTFGVAPEPYREAIMHVFDTHMAFCFCIYISDATDKFSLVHYYSSTRRL